jgi:hypothetical protein
MASRICGFRIGSWRWGYAGESVLASKRPAKPYPVRGRPAWGSGGMERPAIARVVTAVPTAPAYWQASRADGPRLAMIQKTR